MKCWIKYTFGPIHFFPFNFYHEALLYMMERIKNWELETLNYILLTLPTTYFFIFKVTQRFLDLFSQIQNEGYSCVVGKTKVKKALAKIDRGDCSHVHNNPSTPQFLRGFANSNGPKTHHSTTS